MDHEGWGGQKGRWVTKTRNSYLEKNVALGSICVLGKEKDFFVVVAVVLGLHWWHMEVPRLGVESEL